MSRQRFAIGILLFLAAYGALAIWLSVVTIDRQALVRDHFWLAYTHTPRAPFPDAGDAWSAARTLVARLNASAPRNPCQREQSAFALADRLPQDRACIVTIGVTDKRLVVQGYDTQGLPMDSYHEALYPPAGY